MTNNTVTITIPDSLLAYINQQPEETLDEKIFSILDDAMRRDHAMKAIAASTISSTDTMSYETYSHTFFLNPQKGTSMKATSSMRLVLLPKEPVLLPAADWLTSCDNCAAQEEGGHYCLLYGIPVTDMNITTCARWEAKNK